MTLSAWVREKPSDSVEQWWLYQQKRKPSTLGSGCVNPHGPAEVNCTLKTLFPASILRPAVLLALPSRPSCLPFSLLLPLPFHIHPPNSGCCTRDAPSLNLQVAVSIAGLTLKSRCLGAFGLCLLGPCHHLWARGWVVLPLSCLICHLEFLLDSVLRWGGSWAK